MATKKKIAVIEDDLAISQMYLLKFEADGFDAAAAEDGIEGIKLIKSMTPDIVLLDLMMPNMNGVEVLQEMRAEDWGQDVPVMILTNMGKEEAPDELKDLNVLSYIVKAEMTPKQVSERVREALKTTS
jgi:DNA-binding response OmpR family regulator